MTKYNGLKFSHLNGKAVCLINERVYKNHIIQKIIYRGIECYSVDREKRFFLLKDAKYYIDYIES